MDFKYSIKSNKNYKDTLLALEASLAEHKFGVLWKLDIKDQLTKKGLDTDIEFNIFEVCNAAKAKEVLEKNILVGYFLPCKIVIYNDCGDTTVGMIRTTTIVNLLNDERLIEFAKEVETILISAIESAAK